MPRKYLKFEVDLNPMTQNCEGNDLESRITRLEMRMETLEMEIADLKDDVAALKHEVANLKKEIADLKLQLTYRLDKLEQNEVYIAKCLLLLKEGVDELKQGVDELREGQNKILKWIDSHDQGCQAFQLAQSKDVLKNQWKEMRQAEGQQLQKIKKERSRSRSQEKQKQSKK